MTYKCAGTIEREGTVTRTMSSGRPQSDAEAITAIRRRYDALNREASALLVATGYASISANYSTEISVEQTLRAAEFAAALLEKEK
tara:strand:- start:475 stop:732 length:258 start_codon:yes stop_codon:yes gene_type:complete